MTNDSRNSTSNEKAGDSGTAKTMRENTPLPPKKTKPNEPILNEDMEPTGDPSRLGSNDL